MIGNYTARAPDKKKKIKKENIIRIFSRTADEAYHNIISLRARRDAPTRNAAVATIVDRFSCARLEIIIFFVVGKDKYWNIQMKR